MTVQKALDLLKQAIQSDPRYQAYQNVVQASHANAKLQEKLCLLSRQQKALSQETAKESPDLQILLQLDEQVNATYEELLELFDPQRFQQAKQQLGTLSQEVFGAVQEMFSGAGAGICTGSCGGCRGCQNPESEG